MDTTHDSLQYISTIQNCANNNLCQSLGHLPSLCARWPNGTALVLTDFLHMQIRRPNNYDYNIAVTLGFTEPNPVIDLNQLEIVRTVVQDSPNKLFVGGLPCEWTEDQVTLRHSPAICRSVLQLDLH